MSALQISFTFCRNLLDGPVPPSQLKQLVDGCGIEAGAEQPRRIATDDSVGVDVGGDDGLCRDDRSIPDLYARHQGGAMADPYIVADDGVSLVGPLLRHCCGPRSSEDGEG